MIKEMDVFFDKINDCFQIRNRNELFIISFNEKIKSEIFTIIIEQIKKNKNILSYNFIYNYCLKLGYKKNEIIEVIGKIEEFFIYIFEKENGKVESSDSQTYNYYIKKIAIISSNSNFSKLIIEKLKKNKQFNITLFDINELISKSDEMKLKKIKENELVILDCYRFNPNFLIKFNEFFLNENIPWLLVLGINAGNLSMGPLFIPNITGCYFCFISRLKSNMQNVEYFEAYEKFLNDNNRLSVEENHIFKNNYLEITACLLESEINKYLYNFETPSTFNYLIEFNISSFEIKKNRLLKIPYCKFCSKDNEILNYPYLEPIFENIK